jgi:hypothetical protein
MKDLNCSATCDVRLPSAGLKFSRLCNMQLHAVSNHDEFVASMVEKTIEHRVMRSGRR